MKIVSKVDDNKLIMGAVILSWPHLFEPASFNNTGEKKYSVRILIDKKDENIETTKANLRKAMENAISYAQEKNGLFKGGIPKNFRWPLRDGDVELDDSGQARHQGYYFMDLKSKETKKPGVVDRNGTPITDLTEIYGGVYASVSIGFYAYDQGANKGVGAGLGNVQKLGDGEPLGNVSTPATDFGDFNVDTTGLNLKTGNTGINISVDDGVFSDVPF